MKLNLKSVGCGVSGRHWFAPFFAIIMLLFFCQLTGGVYGQKKSMTITGTIADAGVVLAFSSISFPYNPPKKGLLEVPYIL